MAEEPMTREEIDKIEDEMLVIIRRLREKYDLTSIVILANKQTIGSDSFETQPFAALSGNVYSSKFQAYDWGRS